MSKRQHSRENFNNDESVRRTSGETSGGEQLFY